VPQQLSLLARPLQLRLLAAHHPRPPLQHRHPLSALRLLPLPRQQAPPALLPRLPPARLLPLRPATLLLRLPPGTAPPPPLPPARLLPLLQQVRLCRSVWELDMTVCCTAMVTLCVGVSRLHSGAR
jgi:hypothetical protein